jgi:hypothetical protein
MEPTDIEGPLTRFQATTFSKPEIRQLLTTINAAAGENALKDADLDEAFEMWWPRLEKAVTEALQADSTDTKKIPKRLERDLLEEAVLLLRHLVREQSELKAEATRSATVAALLTPNATHVSTGPIAAGTAPFSSGGFLGLGPSNLGQIVRALEKGDTAKRGKEDK